MYERAGIRTPDNLIKSQEIEQPVTPEKYTFKEIE